MDRRRLDHTISDITFGGNSTKIYTTWYQYQSKIPIAISRVFNMDRHMKISRPYIPAFISCQGLSYMEHDIILQIPPIFWVHKLPRGLYCNEYTLVSINFVACRKNNKYKKAGEQIPVHGAVKLVIIIQFDWTCLMICSSNDFYMGPSLIYAD